MENIEFHSIFLSRTSVYECSISYVEDVVIKLVDSVSFSKLHEVRNGIKNIEKIFVFMPLFFQKILLN